MRRHRATALVIGWLLAASGAVPAAADYRDSYARGVQAIERSRWSEAERWMRQAIAERPQAGGDLVQIYGKRYEDYLPYYYLGLALYRGGDFEGAAEAWDESERQGAIRRARQQYRDLQKYRTEIAESRPAAAEPPVPPETETAPAVDPAALAAAVATARQALDRAGETEARIRAAERSPDGAAAFAADADLRQRRDQAAELLRSARARLQRAQTEQDPAGAEEARGLAAQAFERFSGLDRTLTTLNEQRREQAQRREQERQERVAALRTELEGLDADAERALSQIAARAAGEPALAGAGRTLGDLRGRLERTGAEEGADRLGALRDDFAGALAAARKALAQPPPEPPPAAAAKPGPPAVLLAAARAYSVGDYQTVVSLLAKPDLPDPKAVLQARLLRAASRHALYLLGGEHDSDLLRQATEDARTCRRLDARFSPDPIAFSPRFLAFYRNAS
jgi:hypothetical protein